MVKIEVLVGMIATGKSAYARRRAEAGALVVCHDDLTTMLHCGYRYEPGLRHAYRTMEELIALAAVNEGLDVVVDRTHLTREARARWVDFPKVYARRLHFDVRVVAVTFPGFVHTPSIHAGRRYAADPRGRTEDDWLRVAEHHASQALHEPLDSSEGFDAIEVNAPAVSAAVASAAAVASPPEGPGPEGGSDADGSV